MNHCPASMLPAGTSCWTAAPWVLYQGWGAARGCHRRASTSARESAPNLVLQPPAGTHHVPLPVMGVHDATSTGRRTCRRRLRSSAWSSATRCCIATRAAWLLCVRVLRCAVMSACVPCNLLVGGWVLALASEPGVPLGWHALGCVCRWIAVAWLANALFLDFSKVVLGPYSVVIVANRIDPHKFAFEQDALHLAPEPRQHALGRHDVGWS